MTKTQTQITIQHPDRTREQAELPRHLRREHGRVTTGTAYTADGRAFYIRRDNPKTTYFRVTGVAR